MSLFDKLNEKEVRMMDRYITEYASYDHVEVRTLMKYWDTAKSQYLYQLLGNQFIVSHDFEYNKGITALNNEYCKFLNDRHSASAKFIRQFDRFLWENRVALGNDYFKLQDLTSNMVLLKSKYEGNDFEVYTPEGKTIKIQKGCRPLRMIARVLKAYGNPIDTLDGFQTEVSQVTNQRKLKGTITLSIHPLDYMTMSDNSNGWTSCMSWRENGCYCRGTVEMMNSDCVLVAYLTGDNTYRMPGGDEWNSKKWRELFIVTPDIITGVKGYPYQNEDLVQCVNSWLRDLAVKNLGWTQFADQENFAYDHRNTFTLPDGRDMLIEFETNTMYNDFGSIDYHYGIISKNAVNEVCCNYSGIEMCMACGSTSNYFDSEGALVCENCQEDYVTCENCGDRLYEGDEYELDGYYYCSYCYSEIAEEDDLTGGEHHRDNMVDVFLLNDEAAKTENLEHVNWSDYPSLRTYYAHVRSGAWNGYKDFFNNIGTYEQPTTWSSRTRYFVTPSMLKDINDIERYFDEDVADWT